MLTHENYVEDALNFSKTIYFKKKLRKKYKILFTKNINFFKNLISKSGLGFAGNKTGYWSDNISYNNISFYKDWIKISENRILKAKLNVPDQGEWDCGPNSALRAIYLMGYNWSNSYADWRDNCPKTLGLNNADSFETTLLTYAARIATLGLTNLLIPDAGPKPPQLSNYLRKKLHVGRSVLYEYSSFNQFALDTEFDITIEKAPRIILLVKNLFNIHYVT